MRVSARRGVPVLLLSVVALASASAGAQFESGVSDERVSLPDGPGSIGGVGENISLEGNMGMMSYSVPFAVPKGHADATPSMALSYNSGGGSSVVGVGWSFDMPAIERMSLRGLPEYSTGDEFAGSGGEELVYVGMLDGTRVYRARYEGSFLRFRWYEAAEGAAGYWTVESPNGVVSYFGADETGRTVDTSRVTNTDGGVFRYHLVAAVDSFGNVIRYTYIKDGEQCLVSEVGYGFAHGEDVPRFSLQFDYEERPDVISTGVPGFVLALRRRLAEVRVLSLSEIIRRYLLTYETPETSGGVSRLAEVEQRGRGDATTPIHFRFGYSRSLGGVCDDCEGPYMVDMGSLPPGVNLRNGRATLLDVNGDALPDVLSTSISGRHTWVPAQLNTATGEPGFGAAYASAATPGDTPFILSSPGVQVLDVNGDGFTDIISSRTGEVMCNNGTGDWTGAGCLMNSLLPVLEEDQVGESNPLHVRFFDYDNDKRIDMIRTLVDSTEVHVNTPGGFVQTPIEFVGAQFDEGPLQFADMNGDGLQDPVEVLAGGGTIRFRYNLGFGRWTEAHTVALTGFGAAEVDLMDLQDINGDGLADVVVVSGDRVKYAVNRNENTFDAAVTITSADVDGDLPSRDGLRTVVLYADMNGTGSDDIVWVTDNKVDFLELFPTKPNLLTHIDNGIGFIQEVEYGTSVVEQARDAASDPWVHQVPFAMNVVTEVDIWNTLSGSPDGSGLHERRRVSYRDGFYDGDDKTFRGYGTVTSEVVADPTFDAQEAALIVAEYDVGATDPYRHGKMIASRTFGGEPGAWSPIDESRYEHAECPLADVPESGLRLPVRYVCMTRDTRVIQEGAEQSEWVTVDNEQEYDGYGQVVRTLRHGVVHRGSPENPVACEACGDGVSGPCGPLCLGDEVFAETDFIDPGENTGGAWQLGMAWRQVTYGEEGGERTEVRTRYDGEDFVGLPEGQFVRGAMASQRSRITAGEDAWRFDMRYATDEYGNIVGKLSPNASGPDATTYRREYTYDTAGLRISRTELLVENSDGPYRLRRDFAYEASYLQPAEATNWMTVVGDTVTSARNSTRYRYDDFQRPIEILSPGDPDGEPTLEYSYVLGDPISRIIEHKRTAVGGPVDVEIIHCVDGQGREVQSRTKIDGERYMVTGFRVFNSRGEPIRVYQPYESTGAACETTPPGDVGYRSSRYDALERIVEFSEPDEELHGSRTRVRYEYAPLRSRQYDGEDMDETSPHTATPLVTLKDGLGRTVRHDRLLAGGVVASQTLRYDTLGRLVELTDAEGNSKQQEYDLLGRVTRVLDPNGGERSFEYDVHGNRTLMRDARGSEVRWTYDGLDRATGYFDPADEAGTRVTMGYDMNDSCEACENVAGKLTWRTYPLGELGLGRDDVGFDARSRSVRFARTIGSASFETLEEFDAIGRRTATTHPNGERIMRAYDGVSRPTEIAGIIDSITYDNNGQVSSTIFANGSGEEYDYDARMHIAALRIRTSDGGVLQGYEYTRDRIGNVLRVDDVSDPGDLRPSLGMEFGYDAWYRTTSVELDDETIELTYDAIDNVTSRTSSLGAASRAHVGSMTYDDEHPNQVTDAVRIYTYDEAGHVVTRGEAEYEWDAHGRLVGTFNGEDTQRIYYGPGADRVVTLDPQGGSTYRIGGELDVRDGILNIYPRHASRRVARLRSDALQTTVLTDVAPIAEVDGAIHASDAWVAHARREAILPGDSGTSEARALLRGAARRLLLDGDVDWLHHDHLGSVVASTNASGEVQGEKLFYPFGEVRYESGFTDVYGFAGAELDPVTGMSIFQHRHLDSATGRWASTDPAFWTVSVGEASRFGEALTGYAYVANNPYNANDPSGLGKIARFFNRLFGVPGEKYKTDLSVNSGSRNMDNTHGTIMMNATQRAEHLVTVKNGLLYQGGRPMTTPQSGNAVVMTGDGRIYSAPKIRYRVHHSSFMAGQDVAGAGMLYVHRGRIVALSNGSGHYRPSPSQTSRVRTELTNQGARGGGFTAIYDFDMTSTLSRAPNLVSRITGNNREMFKAQMPNPQWARDTMNDLKNGLVP